MTELEHLHQVILIISNEIKRICEKNGIPYSLEGGTMLGAVRHQGFIPWDDDFDFAMLRKDYTKFISACRDDLDMNKFELVSKNSNEKYAFEFAKIQLKGTFIDEAFSIHANVPHGIFVDVFPYDPIPDQKILRALFLKINHVLKNLVWISCDYGTPAQRNTNTYKILKNLTGIITSDRLKRIRGWLLDRVSEDSQIYFLSDYPNCKLDKYYFSNLRLFTFERSEFFGYVNYNQYLTMLYGKYMVIPKGKDRVTHTKQRVEFGKY